MSFRVRIWGRSNTVPVKFGPKGTDLNMKDACFAFHTWRAVQSAIADLLVKNLVVLGPFTRRGLQTSIKRTKGRVVAACFHSVKNLLEPVTVA